MGYQRRHHRMRQKGRPMPRSPRRLSKSGYYHVTARGSGRQAIFEDDDDRRAVLDTLDRQFEKHGVVLLAWCLMENHVHLLIDDASGNLSKAMHDLITCHAQRLNRRTGHVGHVFQDRFGSEAIEDDAYLLEAVRYIHDNPERAGICLRDEYPWSSYWEYLGQAGHASTELVLGMLGGTERFVEFSEGRGSPFKHMRRKRVPDERAHGVACQVLDGEDPGSIKALPKDERDKRLRTLRAAGLSVRQVERLTGVGRWSITRATT